MKIGSLAGVQENSHIINRLTALWALSESGLGGIMHAMKIPLTGFFIGGFAVIIIALLAHFSNRNSRVILRSCLLVLIVKAAVSPHSPLMAYVAVAFQGLAGAAIFGLISRFLPACMLFGFTALVESALQKFLVLTILFGKSIWESLDLFISGLLKDFHLPTSFSFSIWLIVLYTVAHAIWGVLAGRLAAGLPLQLERKSAGIIMRYHALPSRPVEAVIPRRRRGKWITWIMLLLFITIVLVSEGQITRSLYVILRTIAVMIILFYILQPLVIGLLRTAGANRNTQVEILVNQLPEIRNLVRPAYKLASESERGLNKYMAFILNLVVLAMMPAEEKIKHSPA